jgi:hypothetical protein
MDANNSPPPLSNSAVELFVDLPGHCRTELLVSQDYTRDFPSFFGLRQLS